MNKLIECTLGASPAAANMPTKAPAFSEKPLTVHGKTSASKEKQGWFVSASYGKPKSDQTSRFISEGIWENGCERRYLDQVRTMRLGDRIAIKTLRNRPRDVPFDNRGRLVSVLTIKATGTIVGTSGNGRHVRVAWDPLEPAREWYFYTNTFAVWHVIADNWMSNALLAFAFSKVPQDIDRFRNDAYWRDRFGDAARVSKFFQTRLHLR